MPLDKFNTKLVCRFCLEEQPDMTHLEWDQWPKSKISLLFERIVGEVVSIKENCIYHL